MSGVSIHFRRAHVSLVREGDIVCGFVVGCFLAIESSEAKMCRKYASNVPAEVYPLLAPGVL